MPVSFQERAATALANGIAGTDFEIPADIRESLLESIAEQISLAVTDEHNHVVLAMQNVYE